MSFLYWKVNEKRTCGIQRLQRPCGAQFHFFVHLVYESVYLDMHKIHVSGGVIFLRSGYSVELWYSRIIIGGIHKQDEYRVHSIRCKYLDLGPFWSLKYTLMMPLWEKAYKFTNNMENLKHTQGKWKTNWILHCWYNHTDTHHICIV